MKYDEDAMISAPRVRAKFGITEMTLYRWVHDADLGFPQPLKVRERNFFRASELLRWETEQAGKSARARRAQKRRVV
jgi:predicted DNA-binding transcriptional regulator AlpA